jgi:hypothetical protein
VNYNHATTITQGETITRDKHIQHQHTTSITLGSDSADTTKPPNHQNDREHNTSEAEPPSGLIPFQQRLRALLVFESRFMRNVSSDDCNETQSNGLADLSYRLVCIGVCTWDMAYLRDGVENAASQSLGLLVEHRGDQKI